MKKDFAKFKEKKEEIYDNRNKGRILTLGNKYSEKVCSQASKTLNKYYKTGDFSNIGLDDGNIECKDKDKDYMKNLISIASSIDNDKEDTKQLRNLRINIDEDELIDYIMRFIGMIIFAGISLLSIIGWIICCFCCCCDCRCCNCCLDKEKCKKPCFIFTYFFYSLSIIVCILEIGESNKVFEGIADVECSFLQFFTQIINGEIKPDLPKWSGIGSIKNILIDINNTIYDMSIDSYERLNKNLNNISNSKQNFIEKMHEIGYKLFDKQNNKFFDPYEHHYKPIGDTGYPLEGDYVYDLVYNFGRYDNLSGYTPFSYLYLWNIEFSYFVEETFDILIDVQRSFKDILHDNIGKIQKALTDGTEAFDDFLEICDDINEEISELFYNIYDAIEYYGKIGVYIFFGVVMFIILFLAILILSKHFFSNKPCASFCCCKCFFKSCQHILWNILAFFMVLSLLIGSILSLVGRFGDDIMSLLSIILYNEPRKL